MFTVVFGSLDQALSTATRLHKRHAQVTGCLAGDAGPFPQGSLYSANEIAALRWVHAKLVDTMLAVYELIYPALSEPQRQQYYSECKLLARLYGIPEDRMPETWEAFTAYNKREIWDSDTLTVGADARRIAEALLEGGAVWLSAPGWYRAVTASLLPPRMREAFGPAGLSRLARQAALRRPLFGGQGATIRQARAGFPYQNRQPAVDRSAPDGQAAP